MQITDPQIARLFERVDTIAKGIDELKPLMTQLVALQTDQAHIADHIKQLNTITEMRGVVLHQIDKRVLVIERWHKGLMWFTGFALSVIMALGGYAKQFIDTQDSQQRDTRQRITALEFIVSGPNFERAMSNPPVATGKK
ncbi:hypothetical protein RE432_18265 [Pusillimonas sp. SM2304]|uniref:hypothetical protein n=1 Tax=Pusillimonas sp. SM2304 TaxID=3073241 RepID=UPI0028756083|nr:hypothetical protein [Pusillimonas sp. SM2304]MDS1142382.1 hypothetical protein [Pusillimonas sp. SM2304]